MEVRVLAIPYKTASDQKYTQVCGNVSLITTIREKRGGRKIKSKRKMVNELIALGNQREN